MTAIDKKVPKNHFVIDKKRVLVRPKISGSAINQEDRILVAQAARRVIAEHRDVLVALKDR